MLNNYLLTAWRSLRKNASTSFLNIFGLSAGMTAAVLIFLWVNNERSFDRYHPDSKNIYRITSYISVAKWTWETAPLALVDPIRKQIPEVQTVSCVRTGFYGTTVRLGNELFTEPHMAFIDSAWFSLFHYDFVRGNPTGFFSNPFNVLLTESKAKKYFAAGDPIGQTLRIDSITYRVAAIVKDNPSNSSFQFDMLIPNDASALAEARAIWSRYITDAPFDYNFLDDEFNNLYKSDSKTSTLMLLFSVIAILISCLGLVGLAAFTARQRIKEIGIRKVLGATIPDIIGLLSWDFMRLVLLSVLIATPIAWWSMHLWLQDFAYHIPLGGWTFALAGAIAIGIALLTVSSQSVKAASANPVKNLRSE